MKKISPPDIDPVVIYLMCIDSFTNVALKNRFYNSLYYFTEMYEIFFQRAARANLRSLSVDYLPSDITKDEWIKLYEEKLVQSVNARVFYDIIKTSSPNGKCLLCMSGNVSQVDHHLPKTRYPVLSVALLNLFPTCADCNKNKTANIPTAPQNEYLHPYFDDIDSEEWLVANVIQSHPVSLTFAVTHPLAWNVNLHARVQNHFTNLKLGNMFTIDSADELSSRIQSFTNLYNAAGEPGLRAQLKENYDSAYIYSHNSWRTALYKALWQSDWFCNGGFIR